MSCDKTMACFIDERIAKYYFKVSTKQNLNYTLSSNFELRVRNTRSSQSCAPVEMVVVVCALKGVDPGCSLMRWNYLESNFYRYSEKLRFRERCERVLFFYNGKGKFSTEFCDASFLFVCFCTRLKFSAHASVFCFCLLLFFTRS